MGLVFCTGSTGHDVAVIIAQLGAIGKAKILADDLEKSGNYILDAHKPPEIGLKLVSPNP